MAQHNKTNKQPGFMMNPQIQNGIKAAGNPAAARMIVDTKKLNPGQAKMVESIAKKQNAMAMTHRAGAYMGLEKTRDANGRSTVNGMKMSAMYQTDNKGKTFDYTEEDLNPVEKFFNNLTTSDFNLGGGGKMKGDVLRHKRRFGGKGGDVNYLGETIPFFNFFPPAEEDKIKGPIAPSTFGFRDSGTGKPVTIGGDSMFFDFNQDGTMIGRGIKKVMDYFNK